MKKLFALILALMIVLTCTSAFAQTVYTQVTIDSEVATSLLTGFGVPEDQLAMVNPILALVNALGVNVITAQDGAQIDLDLNGNAAVSLGFASDAQGITIASTLFPNYVVTMTQETMGQFMEQLMANMPSAGTGEGSVDMAAMQEIFGGYFQRWFEACASAGKAGEPVSGEYEFEGQTFDTMVPITVDVPAIADATKSLMDELLADPAAMAALKGMAQGMAQSSGAEFDADNFETEFKAGFEEWLAHFPDTAEAEYYCNAEEGVPFYLVGKADREGNTYAYDMLFIDETNMDMAFTMTGEQNMEAGFAMENGSMSMYFSMDGMYLGLVFAGEDNQMLVDLYFMNTEKPLVSVAITIAEGGERTLSMDAEGKNVLAVEDAMSDQTGEAVQGLMGDVMGNGLGTLMGTLSSEVPEIAGLMSMFSGDTAIAG